MRGLGVDTIIRGLPAVLIPVGSNWQSVIDSRRAGTKFVIATGTHVAQKFTTVPGKHDGNILEFQPGAKLDCNNVQDAFAVSGNAARITLRGISPSLKGRITNGNPPMNTRPTAGQQAMIYPFTSNAQTSAGNDWLIENMEIDNSVSGGLAVATGMRVITCYLHHNREFNIIGGGSATNNAGTYTRIDGLGERIVIAGCEVSYGNYLDEFDVGFGAGGFKLVFSEGALIGLVGVRPFLADDGLYYSNWFHHNHGPAIWKDIDNHADKTLYNLCEDNDSTATTASCAGIFHEISFDSEIAYNFVRRNSGHASYVFNGQIIVAASPNVNVHDNKVWTPNNTQSGICLIQQNRDADFPSNLGAHIITGCSVQNNELWLPGGINATGQARSGLFPAYAESTVLAGGNVMNNNLYHADSTSAALLSWPNVGPITLAVMRASPYFQEINGSIVNP